MRKCLQINNLFTTLVLAVVLTGCGSNPPPPKIDIHPLEQNAVNALRQSQVEIAAIALDDALQRYRSIDDLAGQWRIHHMQARMALAADDIETARHNASALIELAALINSPDIAYGTHLMIGRVNEDPAEFSAALRYAVTPLQQAVAQAYLGKTSEAMALLDPVGMDSPADRAFIYYQHARATNSAPLFDTALRYYQAADDTRGVADALFGLARIAAAENRTGAARTFGGRAERVLRSSGDPVRADAVARWVNNL